LALVANFGGGAAAPGKAKAKAKVQAKAVVAAGTGSGAFWFESWRVAGSKVQAHHDRAFGPILFSQYTLSSGVLKLTAQMPPLGAGDSRVVRLQVRKGDEWTTLAEESIHPEARTATFRIASWDAEDVPYRLAYTLSSAGGRRQDHFWTGTVRRDPV